MQGGYFAKQCPVRAQNDALVPAEPVPVSTVAQRRIDQGVEFEEEVVGELLELHPDAVVIDVGGEEGEAATREAMERGLTLILGARLPSDPVGRRVGKPDLLVATRGGGYRPVDVKHHLTLEAAPDTNGIPALCSDLGQPSLEDADIDAALWARRRKEDLLQLAHYQRILEAAGLEAPDGRYGGIIGVEGRVVWLDLDSAVWRTRSSTGKQKLRTTMEVYDFEFDFRLDIVAVARERVVDPSVELLVVPVRVSECDECPWWDYCRPKLEAGSGDVSLLPRVGWREWKIHRDHGVTDRAGLASLDGETARLVAAGVDVAGLLEATGDCEPGTPLAVVGVISRRKAQLVKLEAAGVSTVADATHLNARTASYSGSGLASLPEQIDMARAALAPAPVYRRRGVAEVTVPRADVEVDVDMENVEEGVYLWGALITDRSGPEEEGYRPFVTWEPLETDVQVENFVEFWEWLKEVRAESRGADRTFRAYCYNAGAENTYLRSLGLTAGISEEVEEFIDSGEWVDMLRVFDSQLITGTGSGLKVVAPLARFSWEVEDPGGDESMLWYDFAMGSESQAEREEARRWLLTYNRGDVEATLAIRDWLEKGGGSIPPIESLEPHR
jgi:predicted RecB family nuclease